MRSSYCAETDPPRLEKLIEDYEHLKFDQAYGTPYRKPKHHCIKHLVKYLSLLGPFRNYWCFGFESFLQLLKRMFEACNWKSPVYSVARLWAMRRSFIRKWGLGHPELDYDFSSNLLLGEALTAAANKSAFATAVLQQCENVSALRFLSSVTRGVLALEVSEWLMVQTTDFTIIGQVKVGLKFGHIVSFLLV